MSNTAATTAIRLAPDDITGLDTGRPDSAPSVQALAEGAQHIRGEGDDGMTRGHEEEVRLVDAEVIADEDVSLGMEEVEDLLAHLGVRLDADERGAEPLDAKPGQRLRLGEQARVTGITFRPITSGSLD